MGEEEVEAEVGEEEVEVNNFSCHPSKYFSQHAIGLNAPRDLIFPISYLQKCWHTRTGF